MRRKDFFMRKDLTELKNKSIDELTKALSGAKKRLNKLKLDIAQAKNSKIHEVKKEKKDIARILTLIREKQWSEFERQKGDGHGK